MSSSTVLSKFSVFKYGNAGTSAAVIQLCERYLFLIERLTMSRSSIEEHWKAKYRTSFENFAICIRMVKS